MRGVIKRGKILHDLIFDIYDNINKKNNIFDDQVVHVKKLATSPPPPRDKIL